MSFKSIESKIFYYDYDEEDDEDDNEDIHELKTRIETNNTIVEVGNITFLSLSLEELNKLKKATNSLKNENFEHGKTKIEQLKGYFLAVLSALGFCISQVLMKRAKYLSPTDHSTIRYVITLLVMILILRYKKLNILGPRKYFKLLAVRGLIGSAAFIVYYFAIMFLSPSDTVTLIHVDIIITVIVSRVFLNEALSVVHLIAIVFTLNGIVFISKPSFIFNNETNVYAENVQTIIGIIFALLSALGTSCQYFIIKKLTNKKVHWACSVIYGCWTGIPMSMCISAILVHYESYHKSFVDIEIKVLPMDLLISFIAGCISLFSQVVLNIAFKYEESTRIAIAKTSDVLFSCILQYFLLNIIIDLYGLLGSCLVLLGTILILVFKLVENKYKNFEFKKSLALKEEHKKVANKEKSLNFIVKIIFFKI